MAVGTGKVREGEKGRFSILCGGGMLGDGLDGARSHETTGFCGTGGRNKNRIEQGFLFSRIHNGTR